jgi:hypothetical protein
MFTNNPKTQPQSRHPQSASKSRPVRPAAPSYERGSSFTKPSFFQTPNRQPRRASDGSRSSSSVGKRRSSSLSRQPTYHVHSTSPHHQYGHNGGVSPNLPHPPHSSIPRDSYSDADSAASAPSLKYHKELRDPSSTSTTIGRPLHHHHKGKQFRDDSPASRRSASETSQKHVKMARKVIEGKESISRVSVWLICPYSANHDRPLT